MNKNAVRTEKREKGRLLSGFLKGSKRFFAASIAASAVTSIADMINPQIIRAAIDCAIGGKKASLPKFMLDAAEKLGGFSYLGKHLWILALCIMAVAAVQVMSQYANRVYTVKASETLVKTMRDSLFSHIERLPFSWHMKNKTGDIIQRCTSDIDTTRNFLSEQLTSVFKILLMLFLSVGFMFSMNTRLTLIALIPMPFIIMYSVHFHKNIHESFEKCDENEGKLSAIAQENLTGVRVVRAFGLEKAEIDKFDVQNEYYTSLWVRMSRIMSKFWSISDAISAFQIMLVIIFGAFFCIGGSLSEGEYLAFISYNAMLSWPIRQLGRMISEMSKAGVSIDRIYYIMKTPIETDAPNAATPALNKDIKFENVSFSYDGIHKVLDGVSFEIKPGTTLGILGGTGSGKSTVALLLDKLYELGAHDGKITIGGVDIREIKTSYLRKNIGIVLQEPYLFSRTIAENISIAKPSAGIDEIRKASRGACLDETVMSFTHGYDTVVGERGVTLSGGQKQRAAIARMLMSDVPIMIFDDSLSAVDTETDAKIRNAISERFGKATIIIISHRITTLCKADNVLVLEKGKVSEFGTHEELKNACGIYQKIYRTQSEVKDGELN